MARISGVNIPDNKHIVVSLTYIYGIGRARAKMICEKLKIEPSVKVKDLSENNLDIIREEIRNNYETEGDLRRFIASSIKRLIDIGSYRGIRHKRSLPVRGQRTKTNALTCKKRSGKRR